MIEVGLPSRSAHARDLLHGPSHRFGFRVRKLQGLRDLLEVRVVEKCLGFKV